MRKERQEKGSLNEKATNICNIKAAKEQKKGKTKRTHSKAKRKQEREKTISKQQRKKRKEKRKEHISKQTVNKKEKKKYRKNEIIPLETIAWKVQRVAIGKRRKRRMIKV